MGVPHSCDEEVPAQEEGEDHAEMMVDASHCKKSLEEVVAHTEDQVEAAPGVPSKVETMEGQSFAPDVVVEGLAVEVEP